MTPKNRRRFLAVAFAVVAAASVWTGRESTKIVPVQYPDCALVSEPGQIERVGGFLKILSEGEEYTGDPSEEFRLMVDDVSVCVCELRVGNVVTDRKICLHSFQECHGQAVAVCEKAGVLSGYSCR
jgi:hypothetical protein